MPERRREVTLRFLAEPTDINFGGKVHGGTVMKWIDQAGYACAVGWSGQYCVTVYVGGIRFYKPILIGHVVEVRARVVYTGRTSMHVAVDVRSGDPRDGNGRPGKQIPETAGGTDLEGPAAGNAMRHESAPERQEGGLGQDNPDPAVARNRGSAGG